LERRREGGGLAGRSFVLRAREKARTRAGEHRRSAAERKGDNLNVSRRLPENGWSQGRNLALAVLCVPISLDSGGVGDMSTALREGGLRMPYSLNPIPENPNHNS